MIPRGGGCDCCGRRRARSSSAGTDAGTPGIRRFVLHFDKLIATEQFEPSWLRMERFGSPVGFRLLDRGGLTDALAIGVQDSVTYAPKFYAVGRTYVVTVDTTLWDATGAHPAAPYRFSFVPEPHFRVAGVVFPEGQPVRSRDSVLLYFNVDPATGIGSSIRFEPPVQGMWSVYPYSAHFYHAQPFAFGTRYTLHVDERAMDEQGNHLPQPFATTFEVPPFEIDSTHPYDGWRAVWPRTQEISIGTTGPVDTARVHAAFNVEPPVSGRFVWYPSAFAFQPAADLQPTTLYRVAISTALRAWDGTPLAAPYTFSFTTDAFRVLATDPHPSSIDVAPSTRIYVFFDMQLDPATIEPAFGIAPAVSGTLAVSNPDVLEFQPAVPLAPGRRYVVTVSTDLRAANGAVLSAPYSFEFVTRAPYTPPPTP